MECFPHRRISLKALLLASLLISSFASAADTVVVTVRAIKAEQGAQSDVNRATIDSAALADIRDKLRRLRYDSLTLISGQKREVALNQKDSFEIADGHTVFFRPVYKSDKKVCLWFKWQDRSGMTILDTRLHFDDGETLLTGMSNPDGSGIVMAIDVK